MSTSNRRAHFLLKASFPKKTLMKTYVRELGARRSDLNTVNTSKTRTTYKKKVCSSLQTNTVTKPRISNIPQSARYPAYEHRKRSSVRHMPQSDSCKHKRLKHSKTLHMAKRLVLRVSSGEPPQSSPDQVLSGLTSTAPESQQALLVADPPAI